MATLGILSTASTTAIDSYGLRQFKKELRELFGLDEASGILIVFEPDFCKAIDRILIQNHYVLLLLDFSVFI
jgi:hypothetical protein